MVSVSVKILIWSQRVAVSLAITQLLASTIAFIVILTQISPPADEWITNIAQLHKTALVSFSHCASFPGMFISATLKATIGCKNVKILWLDISCCPAPSDIDDIDGENMVLKTLQMFEADYDLAPYCFWWVVFEGRKFQQECIKGRIPQYCLR